LPFDVTGVDSGQRIGNNVSSNIGLVAWLPSSGKKLLDGTFGFWLILEYIYILVNTQY